MDDDNGSWESDRAFARDCDREPTHRQRQRIPVLVATGTVRAAMGHGPQCSCAWCSEQPLTDAALEVLRGRGLL